MLKRTLLLVTACGTAPLCGIAQTPAAPPPILSPAPAVPPAPAIPSTPERPPRPVGRERSGTFLGVDTSPIPSALSDQLNLAEGFGLLVDYVVPGSAADAAGVKSHDILKMLNDQILTGGEQLSVLVRSFSEGQEVTLLILRKGQEMKLTAKLRKRPATTGNRHAGHEPHPGRGDRDDAFDRDFHLDLGDLSNPDFADRIRDSVERRNEMIEAATERANERVERALEAVRERTARTTGSRLDFDDAHILLRDSTGRIEIRSSHGKRMLTLRDSDGKKVFGGPIDTPEQRKAIPTDVLPQVETLEREQSITFPNTHGDHEDSGD